MATTVAKRLANRKYDEKTYDKITFHVPKGKNDEYKKLASEAGLSLSRLLNLAVESFVHKLEGGQLILPANDWNVLTNDQKALLTASKDLSPAARKCLIDFLESLK